MVSTPPRTQVRRGRQDGGGPTLSPPLTGACARIYERRFPPSRGAARAPPGERGCLRALPEPGVGGGRASGRAAPGVGAAPRPPPALLRTRARARGPREDGPRCDSLQYSTAPWKCRLSQGVWSLLTQVLQRLVDLSGGWDALVGPGPWKAGPGGWWPRMRPVPSMPCSRTPATRPAATLITQSFFRHPTRSLGVGPCRAAPPLFILSSQSYRHRWCRTA